MNHHLSFTFTFTFTNFFFIMDNNKYTLAHRRIARVSASELHLTISQPQMGATPHSLLPLVLGS